MSSNKVFSVENKVKEKLNENYRKKKELKEDPGIIPPYMYRSIVKSTIDNGRVDFQPILEFYELYSKIKELEERYGEDVIERIMEDIQSEQNKEDKKVTKDMKIEILFTWSFFKPKPPSARLDDDGNLESLTDGWTTFIETENPSREELKNSDESLWRQCFHIWADCATRLGNVEYQHFGYALPAEE